MKGIPVSQGSAGVDGGHRDTAVDTFLLNWKETNPKPESHGLTSRIIGRRSKARVCTSLEPPCSTEEVLALGTLPARP